VFLVGAVDDGRAADLGNLLPVSIVRPAADLLAADHVLDEQDPAVETQRQLVKQLNVLQQVVVRVAEDTGNATQSVASIYSLVCTLFLPSVL